MLKVTDLYKITISTDQDAQIVVQSITMKKCSSRTLISWLEDISS